MLLSWAISGQVKTTLGASLRQPLGVALAVFLVLAAIGMLYSSALWPDRLHTLSGWRRFGYALILLGVFASVTWKQRFLAAFFIAASLGLVASFLAWMEIIGSRHGDFTGTVLQNHTTQGMVFSLAILCAAHYARTASTRTRWALAAAVILFAINIVKGFRPQRLAPSSLPSFLAWFFMDGAGHMSGCPSAALAIRPVASPARMRRFAGWNELTVLPIRRCVRISPMGSGALARPSSSSASDRYSPWHGKFRQRVRRARRAPVLRLASHSVCRSTQPVSLHHGGTRHGGAGGIYRSPDSRFFFGPRQPLRLVGGRGADHLVPHQSLQFALSHFPGGAFDRLFLGAMQGRGPSPRPSPIRLTTQEVASSSLSPGTTRPHARRCLESIAWADETW